MTAINRTAYPYFSEKRGLTRQELDAYYTLTSEEMNYVKKNIRGYELRLNFAVLLKVFQYLGYFPELKTIPQNIIRYIYQQFNTIHKLPRKLHYEHESSLQRHRNKIYDYLKIKRWGKQFLKNQDKQLNSAMRHAIKVARITSLTMNYPADIINVVIAELRKNNYELPAFEQLDRLVKHTRATVNHHIFQAIYQKLTPENILFLETLLKTQSEYNRTAYNGLKFLPKKPIITHFKELIEHHQWVTLFDNVEHYLEGIAKIKLQQFAEQAKSLDASDLKNFLLPKRYALMLCLIHKAQHQAKDALAITFCKTIVEMHKNANAKLNELQEQSSDKTHYLLNTFSDILVECKEKEPNIHLLESILITIENKGGAETLHAECEEVTACHSKNYLPLLWDFYKTKRAALFKLIDSIDLQSTTRNDLLIKALNIIRSHKNNKSEYIFLDADLSFTTKQWQKLIFKKDGTKLLVSRRYLEMCVFSYLANELRSGDLFIKGAHSFSDYRQELLPWELCEPIVDDYCKELGLPHDGKSFVASLRTYLINTAKRVDEAYPDIAEFIIDAQGIPILKRRNPKCKTASACWLLREIKKRMPEKNILDILCNTHHYTDWASVFCPISGADPKIDNAIERYIITNFAFGSAMGPTQAAQHIRADISAHMISWINRRHINLAMLDKARNRLINCINTFKLITAWGDGRSCAGDGNLRELYEENLIAEFHVRYGRKGGIAYHHVANNYILLFSTFMPCGVWEAVEIIEGLLKNESDVQPDIIHADTQGQSTIVFALAYLLGFKLMPRIRNWKDLTLYRPEKKSKYDNINSLFGDPINWDLIETHWQDMMQVVLSIKAGKINSSLLLRKLGNYSRKNRLYLAFQELGRVLRTQFLLEYISDVELREIITDTTNKVESYNNLSEWTSFGSKILVGSNDDMEMEKAIKYNDILTNSIILQNVIDITNIIGQLTEEGKIINKEDVAFLSPYLTEHLKRFGDYIVDLENIPKNLEKSRSLVLW